MVVLNATFSHCLFPAICIYLFYFTLWLIYYYLLYQLEGKLFFIVLNYYAWSISLYFIKILENSSFYFLCYWFWLMLVPFSDFIWVFFLCLIAYQSPWIIQCQSHPCRRAVVVSFNPKLREFVLFPRPANGEIAIEKGTFGLPSTTIGHFTIIYIYMYIHTYHICICVYSWRDKGFQIFPKTGPLA